MKNRVGAARLNVEEKVLIEKNKYDIRIRAFDR